MKVDRTTGEILDGEATIVKVQYLDESGEPKGREYTYFTRDKLLIGDIVNVPVRENDTAKAYISAINVPDSEIAKFRDRVKTIPTGSKVEEKQETLFKVDDKGEVAEVNDGTDFTNPFLEMAQEKTEQFYEGEMPNMGQALIKVPPITQDSDIDRLGGEALKIQQYAHNMIVSDIEGDKQATNDLTIIAIMKKQIEAKQKEWIAPLNQHIKEIKEAFSLLLVPLDGADKTLRGKILTYRQEQERIRRAQEEAARLQEEANRAAIEAAKLANDPVVEIEFVPEVIAPEPVKTVRADVGMSSTTKIKKWRYKAGLSQREILEGLPMEYHQVNETKIGQAVRAKDSRVTEADFGGVIELYEEDGLKIRGR